MSLHVLFNPEFYTELAAIEAEEAFWSEHRPDMGDVDQGYSSELYPTDDDDADDLPF